MGLSLRKVWTGLGFQSFLQSWLMGNSLTQITLVSWPGIAFLGVRDPPMKLFPPAVQNRGREEMRLPQSCNPFSGLWPVFVRWAVWGGGQQSWLGIRDWVGKQVSQSLPQRSPSKKPLPLCEVCKHSQLICTVLERLTYLPTRYTSLHLRFSLGSPRGAHPCLGEQLKSKQKGRNGVLSWGAILSTPHWSQ